MMGSQRGRYSPEFKEAAVREVIDNSRTIAEVARSLGDLSKTLGNWVKAYRDAHAGDEPDLTVSEWSLSSAAGAGSPGTEDGERVLGKCAPRARRGALVGEGVLLAGLAVHQMKDCWPFGVALRGEASNHLWVLDG